MNLWPLLGVGVMVAGFALRLNPAWVVVLAGVTAGLLGNLSLGQLLDRFGEAFLRSRLLLAFVLTLPVIGLLERKGLRQWAEEGMQRMQQWMPGRLLWAYQVLRQGAAALGLTGLGGHPQTVRPLLAPMVETAAAVHGGDGLGLRLRVRALAAATDNVALFFGENLFVGFGAVLLIQVVLQEHGLNCDPRVVARWAIPTALAALGVHGWRLYRLDRTLGKGR